MLQKNNAEFFKVPSFYFSILSFTHFSTSFASFLYFVIRDLRHVNDTFEVYCLLELCHSGTDTITRLVGTQNNVITDKSCFPKNKIAQVLINSQSYFLKHMLTNVLC